MFTTIELSFLPITIYPERLKIMLIKTKIFIIPLFISISGQQETYKYYGIWLVCVLVKVFIVLRFLRYQFLKY